MGPELVPVQQLQTDLDSPLTPSLPVADFLLFHITFLPHAVKSLEE